MLSTFWALAKVENNNTKNNKNAFNESVCYESEKFMPGLHPCPSSPVEWGTRGGGEAEIKFVS
jgi:hypothetical protein